MACMEGSQSNTGNAEWCAFNFLMVGGTITEQLIMFDLVGLTWPKVAQQLGICHGSKHFVEIIGAIPAVKKVLAEALEIIE